MIDYKSISRFNNWRLSFKDQENFSLVDYISNNIHPEDVLILSNLFYPQIIEIDGCILLQENYSKYVFKTLSNDLKYDKMGIEKTINRTHVYMLFDNCNDNIEDLVFQNIGKLLQFSWSNYFKILYPQKHISVEYDNKESEYGPMLTFFQL